MASGLREEGRKSTEESSETLQLLQVETERLGFSVGSLLGRGAFSRCYEVLSHSTGVSYAAKVVPKSVLANKLLFNRHTAEVGIHRQLRHPNVVRFEACLEGSLNVYLLLELCGRHSLSDFLATKQTLEETEAKPLIVQLARGLLYIHEQKIVHRDIKLANLFLTENYELKIGDFGLATTLSGQEDRKQLVCGTPQYMAPEMLQGTLGYSYEVDTWAVGIVLYYLLVGVPPFLHTDVNALYDMIKRGRYAYPDTWKLSAEAKDLIDGLLQCAPTKRFTLEAILTHPFLASVPIPVTGTSTTPTRLPTRANPSDIDLLQQESLRFSSHPERRARVREAEAEAEGEKKEDADPLVKVSQYHRTMCLAVKNQRVTMGDTEPGIWVQKWVDYTSQYGLGYMLSNGDCGVHFSDGTNLVVGRLANCFDYIVTACGKPECIESYHFTEYPARLHEKLMLFQEFRESLIQTEAVNSVQSITFYHLLGPGPWFVKKWSRNDQAIMFRLNAGCIHVCFHDRMEVTLNTESKSVSYFDRKGEHITCSLPAALRSSDKGFADRIQYVRQWLQSLHQETLQHRTLSNSSHA